MSRRKQEKPQPRKNIVKGGCEGVALCPTDILTCGACRKDFPLSDIVRFIQHKVQRLCNKENLLDPLAQEDDDDGGDLLLPLKKEEEVTSSSVAVKDTVAHHEPSTYVCSTCRQTLPTAWGLIQHAQAAHGLSICEERAPLLERQTTPPPPPLLLEPPPDPDPTQDSSYSQRLRSLASGGGLLQAHLTTTTNNNNSNSNNNIILNTTPITNGDVPPVKITTPEQTPANGLECEYCRKSFQFRSNLVVHRRSHTGEKPYKCCVCAHACTQASKLKRHMKTHRRQETGEVRRNGGLRLMQDEEDDAVRRLQDSSSCEEGTRGKLTNGSCRSDEDEEEEEEVNGGEDELVIDDEEEDEPEDLTKKKTNGETNNNNNQLQQEELHLQLQQRSVIGEIMHLGLGRIPQFDEAYRQALREQRGGCSEGSSNDASSSCSRSAGQSPLGFESSPSFELQRPKRLRLTTTDPTGHAPLYTGVWFPAETTPPPPPSERSALTGSAGRGQHQQQKGGGRNDTCEFCGKVFKNCSNLTVHRRSHTGEKPYKCELCSYACAQSSKLTRHMKTHGRLGKDVYRCRFCDMPFSVASTLEKHMRKCVTSAAVHHASSNSPYHLAAASSDDSKEMTTVA